jgi:hypothetical protein
LLGNTQCDDREKGSKMIGMSGKKNRIVALAAAVSFACVSPVMAQDEFTSYSTTKGDCAPEQSLENLIYWTPSTISGPGFACIRNETSA